MATKTRTTTPRTVPQGDRIPPRPDGMVTMLRVLMVVLVLLAALRGPVLGWALPTFLPDAVPVPGARGSLPFALPFPNPADLTRNPLDAATAPTPVPAAAPAAGGAAGTPAMPGLDVMGAVRTVVTLIYAPPGEWVLYGLVTLALGVLVVELSLNALLWVRQTRRMRRLQAICLRIRIPLLSTTGGGGSPAQGEDLFRALHRALPHYGSQSGKAPWLALTLGAAPDEPVTAGAVIVGGDDAQRSSLAVTLRKTLLGFDASAVVDAVADPLDQAATPGTALHWKAFTLLHAPSYPVRLPDDATTDVLGPLLASLRGRQGTRYTEYAVVIRPRHDWDLMNGWRAYAMRRLLQLRAKHQYSLTPDVRALQDKIDSPSYDVTLMVQVVAQDPAHDVTAQTEVNEIATLIESQYQARSGTFLQRFAFAGGGIVRVPTPPAKPRPRWQTRLATLASSVGGAFAMTLLLAAGGRDLLVLAITWLRGWVAWLPLFVEPPLGRAWLTAWGLPVLLVVLAALLGPAVLRRRRGLVAGGQRAWLLRRPPRPTPLAPFLLPARIWRSPSILSAAELSGLWHLPAGLWGALVRWLPCRQLPAPSFAFVPGAVAPAAPTKTPPRPARRQRQASVEAPPIDDTATVVQLKPKTAPGVPVTTTYPLRLDAAAPVGDANPPIIVGFADRSDGSLAPVGLPLFYLRQIMHLTAGMGAGKSRLLANIFLQFLRYGCLLGDGKGDDLDGSLVATVRHYIPLDHEDRLVLLDILDTEWPFGINPLLGIDMQRPGGVDMALGQVLAIFGRLDPEVWAKSMGMQQYVRMGALLVFEAQPNPTMAHIKQCLLDETYRAEVLRRCTNIEVKTFWTVTFPKTGEQQRTSLDALLRRFDNLMATETTRYLLTQPLASFDMRAAMDEGLIVLVPMPDMTLGGMASLVGMLVVQALVRAAAMREGSDQTRTTYPIMIDELQVFTQTGALDDIATAITRLRAYGMGGIYAHQALSQIGDLKDLMQTNAQSRVVLKTSEPDASVYGKLYAARGLTAMDIANQDASEHQYAVLQCAEGNTGPMSMHPLEWPDPVPAVPAPDAGPAWQTVLPPVSAAQEPIYRALARLVYDATAFAPLHFQRAVVGLAQLPDDEWDYLLRCWDRLRAFHRQYILDHRGCVSDRMERQRWLSRLRAQQPRVLVAAAYQRQRWMVAPEETPARVRQPQRRTNTASTTPRERSTITGLAPEVEVVLPIPVSEAAKTHDELYAERGRIRAHDEIPTTGFDLADD